LPCNKQVIATANFSRSHKVISIAFLAGHTQADTALPVIRESKSLKVPVSACAILLLLKMRGKCQVERSCEIYYVLWGFQAIVYPDISNPDLETDQLVRLIHLCDERDRKVVLAVANSFID